MLRTNPREAVSNGHGSKSVRNKAGWRTYRQNPTARSGKMQ